MDILKKSLAAVLCYATAAIPSFSQSGYATKWIDFNHGKNSGMKYMLTDNPGIILLDGYLKGKIKGYKANYLSEVMKRGPIDSLEIPPAWEPKVDYYQADRVTYNGKFYEVVIDLAPSRPPSEDPKAWVPYEILGLPVSTRYSFPTEKDTLSKSEFMGRMVSEQPLSYPPWDIGGVYLSSDIVSYKGYAYITSNDITSWTSPDKDHVNWDIYGETGLQFFKPADLVGLEEFTHFQIQSGDTLYSPQLVAPLFFSYATESRHRIVSFMYDDAINYLNSVKLPLLYPGPHGYFMQHQFVLDPESKIALLERVRKQLKLKAVKLPATSLKNPVVFEQFLKDTTQMENSSQWSIHQDLKSGELILHQFTFLDNGFEVIPFATLPIKSFEEFTSVKSVPVKTYWEILQDHSAWEEGTDSVYVDSLKPAPRKINPRKSVSSFCLLETFKAKVDASNPELEVALAEVWNAVGSAFYQKRFSFKFPFQSFYPWKYDWSTIKLEAYEGFSFDKNFTLGSSSQFEPDSIDSPQKFISFSVTYKKVIPQDKKQKPQFAPQEVSVEFIETMEDYAPESRYIMDWQALRKLLVSQNSPTLTKFIGSIENATLKFHQSELSYGLIENKE